MVISARAVGLVAVVTGGNRGMGLETCRQLADRGMKVVLTSRDLAKGKEAAAVLAKESLSVEVHELDVCDERSVESLARHLETQHGRVDVLVNNAGAILDHGARGERELSSVLTADVETLRRSFEVNALGAFLCCKHLVPLMKKHNYGRIVNVSTGMAQLSDMNGGWPGYRMSKVALNALTRILADELAGTGIKVNSVCPGWVRTEMGGPSAPRSIDEGVDTTVWLASLHDDGPSGGFFRDCKQIPW
jgi:NAD(P)-dependent dehydrogenase (short-subunit alcohol dehydrogenase family)